MLLYPAIDLKDGQCVRLLRGDMDKATVFNDDPGAQAASFETAGFERIHLVDLNGAIEGTPVNIDAVKGILKAIDIPAQLGGGIRDIAGIERWLDAGIARVILGTVALEDPELVKTACKAFPGQIAVGIDARDGKVAVKGWVETSEITALELALRFEDAGVAAIVFTDIDRDGAMGGVNVDATADLAFALSTPVIASGGLSSLDDIKLLKAEEAAGIEGAIIGRALYDGTLNPALAILAAR
ncbi:1-(5-phosphoribosyl)-5-[(5-phosphoribosylamino)methylideneamino]imidazole-4-carboxamide isomerase [Alphaproteobacteria bacterium]|jgi:phosphoribosylformimino-5-aminoimidazole carboxamide ribotide isomerase|nr:1-(5-phosphoribosyl)-5-[(5-phosphoribosylamino)methylideneamino]imidazole-4-carboxamide isomerase [Alphaproteobacteria bacterium]